MIIDLDELLKDINNRILVEALKQGFQVKAVEYVGQEDLIKACVNDAVRKMKQRILSQNYKEHKAGIWSAEDLAREKQYQRQRRQAQKTMNEGVLKRAKELGL